MTYAENLFVCIAVPLVIAFLLVKGGSRRFCGFFITGMAVCLFSAYINSFLKQFTGFGIDDCAIYQTPITEECMKLLPLLFYFLIYDPDSSCLMTAAVGVGAGFATFENICYLLSDGVFDFQYVLVRGLAVGIMHISCGLMAGYGLTILKKYRDAASISVLGVFAAIVTCHASYNLLVSVPGISRSVGYILPLAGVAAFMLMRTVRGRMKGRGIT